MVRNSQEIQSRIYQVGAGRKRLRGLYMNSSLGRDRSGKVILARRTAEG